MKISYFFALTLMLSTSLSQMTQASDAKHFIRQTELDPDVFPSYFEDIEVSAPTTLEEVESGSTEAAFSISEWGSRFDLYTTVETASGDVLSLVASSVLGPFPTVSIRVNTEDDGTINENWTRADRQFGIDISVDGISSDPAAPDTFKKVIVHHIAKEYADGSYAFAETEDTSTWRSAKLNTAGEEVNGEITGNGTVSMKVSEDDPDSGTSLHVLSSSVNNDDGDPDLDYAKGEEKVIVYVIAADGTRNPVLEETVRIFPKHDFKIRGSLGGTDSQFKLSPDFDSESDSENVYTEYNSFPNVHALLDDIYPTSVISLKVYEGKLDSSEDTSKLGKEIASGSQITNSSNEPTSNTITIDSETLKYDPDDNSLNPDGFYTVILEYSTPFSKGKKELYSGFAVQREIKVRANIGTAE